MIRSGCSDDIEGERGNCRMSLNVDTRRVEFEPQEAPELEWFWVEVLVVVVGITLAVVAASSLVVLIYLV